MRLSAALTNHRKKNLPNKLTKGSSLGLIALALIGSFALAGQTWFLVSMSPNDEAVILKNFDGYSSYGWISPMLLVCLAALATTAISAGKTRFASLLVGATAAVSLTSLAAIAVNQQDLSGVAKELENATGIAATHGISGLEISTQAIAPLGIGVFGLLGLVFLAALFSQRYWVTKAKSQAPKPNKPVKDAISLWDEQR